MAGRKSRSKARIQGDTQALSSNPFAALADLEPELQPDEDAIPDDAESPIQTDKTTSEVSDINFTHKLVVRKQSKGHGGKTVTIVEGLPLNASQADEMAQTMRKALGCGGRVLDGQLILNGERQSQVAAWLRERGWKRVVVGN